MEQRKDCFLKKCVSNVSRETWTSGEGLTLYEFIPVQLITVFFKLQNVFLVGLFSQNNNLPKDCHVSIKSVYLSTL